MPLGVASINWKETELKIRYSTLKVSLKSLLFTIHVIFGCERQWKFDVRHLKFVTAVVVRLDFNRLI